MFYIFSPFVCCFFNKKENYNYVRRWKIFSRSTETVRCTVCLRLYIAFTVLRPGALPSASVRLRERIQERSKFMVPSNEVSLSLSPSDDNILLAGHSGRGEREGIDIQHTAKDQPKRTKIQTQRLVPNIATITLTEINTDRRRCICIHFCLFVQTYRLFKHTYSDNI